MRNAILLAALAALAGIVGCGGGGSPKTVLPQATGSATGPDDAAGGTVQISARVTSLAGVVLPKAKITAPNGTETIVDMSTGGPGLVAQYNCPPNTGADAQKYSVVVSVTDRFGNTGLSSPFYFYVPTEWFTTTSGAKYREIQPGTQPAAQNGDSVNMYYEGWVGEGDNTSYFQCNFPGHQYYYHDAGIWVQGPFTFTIGAGQVIVGWDEGIPGLKVNGIRELDIPPDLGYGSQERPHIPANSTLHFIVQLVSVGS